MARANLSQQVPALLPDALFLPLNEIWLWAKSLDNSLFKVNGVQVLSDESKASNTVLAASPTLQFALTPGRKHYINVLLATSANVKFRHVGPVGCTVRLTQEIVPSGGAFSKTYAAAFSAADIVPGAASLCRIEGFISVPVTVSGVFAIHWAQNASNATPSLIYDGSRLQYSLVAD